MSSLAGKKMLVVLLIFLYVPYVRFIGFRTVGTSNVDFPTFYAGAKVTFEQGRSPYTREAFANDIELLGEPAAEAVIGRFIPPFLYPPPSLLLFYPLTFFSFRTAKVLLFILNHACVLPFVYIFLGKLIKDDFPPLVRDIVAPLAFIYVMLSFPVFANFKYGQINLIVLILLCAFWYALKNDKSPFLAALPLALAVLLKTYPIVLVPLLLFRRRFRVTLWLFGILMIAGVAAHAILPLGTWHDWVVNVLPTGGYGKDTFNLFSPAQARNHSINGFATRLLTPNRFSEPIWDNPLLGRALGYVLALVIGGLTLSASFFSGRRNSAAPPLSLELSLYVIMMVLLAPLSWESHLVFAFPAVLLALHVLAQEKGKPGWYAAVTIAACVISWPLPLDDPGLTRGLWTLLIPVKFYALLLIWLYLVRAVWRSQSGRMETTAIAHAGDG